MADSVTVTVGIKGVMAGSTITGFPASTVTRTPTGDAYVDSVIAASDSAAAVPAGNIATLKECFFKNLSSTAGDWIDIYDDAVKLARLEPSTGVFVGDLSATAVADLKIIADTGKTPDCRVILFET